MLVRNRSYVEEELNSRSFRKKDSEFELDLNFDLDLVVDLVVDLVLIWSKT